MTAEGREEACQIAQLALVVRFSRFERSMVEPDFALGACHLHEGIREAMLSMARAGVSEAHHCLCEMARFLTQLKDPLPLWLHEYVVSNASAGKKRPPGPGRDRAANIVRDAVITQAVDAVTGIYGLRPTRNTASTGDSGCSLVVEGLARLGLHMTEANVMAVWRAGRERPQIERCSVAALASERKLARANRKYHRFVAAGGS
jgi:hypothetical protein